MIINSKKALECLQALKDYFKEDENIATVEYPSSLKEGEEKWLIYLFYSCLLDYGMKSKLYHSNLIQTYEKYPEIFSPSYVVEHPNLDLLTIMKENIHPRYPNVALKKWVRLSTKLSNLSLLEEIESKKNMEELNQFIKEIEEYGQKTGGLLIRLIRESNILSFKDDVTFIPLDRHDLEISYLNGITSSKKLTEEEIEVLSDCFIQSGKKISLNPILVDKYLWNVGNSFCSKNDCEHCPLKENCRGKEKR